jgi:hypothetical protein
MKTIALMGFIFVIAVIVIIVLIKFLRRKPKKPLKQGDYVMLREKYKDKYPGVPTDYAMVIEEIKDNKAVVVFMTIKNQILRETIAVHALSRAS